MKRLGKFLKRSYLVELSLLFIVVIAGISIPESSYSDAWATGELEYATDIRVWLEDDEDIYASEEDLVFYVRAARDCYATVYVVDTEGFVHIIYPFDPWEKAYIRGGVVYRFSPGAEGIFYSSVPRGIAFIFAVSSPVPFVYDEFGIGVFAGGYGYRIYGDPFIACKRFYISLLPSWAPLARVSVSFSRFYIRTWEPYPRYLRGRRYAYGFNAFDDDFAPVYKMYRRHYNNPYRVLRPKAPLPARSKDYSKIVKVRSRGKTEFTRRERNRLRYGTSHEGERTRRNSPKRMLKGEYSKRERSGLKRGVAKARKFVKNTTRGKTVITKMRSSSYERGKKRLKKRTPSKVHSKRRGKHSSRLSRRF